MGDRLHVRTWTMRLHRWIALTLGAWFALLGLTGSMLVWHGELDRALNPRWFSPRAACTSQQADRPAQPVAQTLSLYARFAAGAAATQVMAPAIAGAPHVVWSRAAGGARIQHFVDPGCGAYLGWREWGAIRLDRAHFVPALYELHRSLLSGETGHVIVGFAGFLLLATAVSGTITAWPRSSTRVAWVRTLGVKRGATARRRLYDLHRATGMWLLPFLLLMSVSGLYLCFPEQAHALVATVLPTTPSPAPAGAADAAPASFVESLPPDALVARAELLWPDATWSRLRLPAVAGETYEVRLLQSREPRMDTGDTRVRLTADGRAVEKRDPLNAPAGDVLIAWLFPLHSGEALGAPGRLAWSVLGMVPLLLFVTGTWLWCQRRLARRRHEDDAHAH